MKRKDRKAEAPRTFKHVDATASVLSSVPSVSNTLRCCTVPSPVASKTPERALHPSCRPRGHAEDDDAVSNPHSTSVQATAPWRGTMHPKP